MIEAGAGSATPPATCTVLKMPLGTTQPAQQPFEMVAGGTQNDALRSVADLLIGVDA